MTLVSLCRYGGDVVASVTVEDEEWAPEFAADARASLRRDALRGGRRDPERKRRVSAARSGRRHATSRRSRLSRDRGGPRQRAGHTKARQAAKRHRAPKGSVQDRSTVTSERDQRAP